MNCRRLAGWMGAAVAALFLCVPASADSGGIVRDVSMPVPNPAAYSSTFTVRTDGISWGSGQVVLTSVTVPAVTFTDGSTSTGSLTVNSFTALSSATASGKITIGNVSYLANSCVSGGGPGIGSFNVCDGTDFTVSASSAATACSLSDAILAKGVLISTCSSASPTVVFTTAAYYGANWNNFKVYASTPAWTITQLTGGRDNQSFKVNGVTFKANTDFYPKTSTSVTATAIATALNAATSTTHVVAQAVGAVVTTTSTVVGTSANYALYSSSNAALSLSAPVTHSEPAATSVMTGGTNSAYVINTSTITATGAAFGTAQGVWYNQGTKAISGLTDKATYYVIDIPADTPGASFMLASSVANAINRIPILLASSQTLTTADSYTLTPTVISGTPSVQWVVSNDGVNWMPYTLTPFNIAIPSVSYGTYFSTGSVNAWDFGRMDYGYLGLSVKAPTTGAVRIKARVVGKE